MSKVVVVVVFQGADPVPAVCRPWNAQPSSASPYCPFRRILHADVATHSSRIGGDVPCSVTPE